MANLVINWPVTFNTILLLLKNTKKFTKYMYDFLAFCVRYKSTNLTISFTISRVRSQRNSSLSKSNITNPRPCNIL